MYFYIRLHTHHFVQRVPLNMIFVTAKIHYALPNAQSAPKFSTSSLYQMKKFQGLSFFISNLLSDIWSVFIVEKGLPTNTGR